jgi:hypothetical protein
MVRQAQRVIAFCLSFLVLNEVLPFSYLVENHHKKSLTGVSGGAAYQPLGSYDTNFFSK